MPPGRTWFQLYRRLNILLIRADVNVLGDLRPSIHTQRRRRSYSAGRPLCVFVPRTQRVAVRCRAGAFTERSASCGPGSAKQREERCIAPGTRQLLPVLVFGFAEAGLVDPIRYAA